MGDDRASVYEEDGKWVYRASAVGGCSRALWAARMGLEGASVPDWLQEKYDQGHAGEDVIVEKLAGMGIVVGERQAEVELFVMANQEERFDVVIRGHIDGMLHGNMSTDARLERLDGLARVLVEIKTMSVDVFEKFKDKPWTAHEVYPGQLKTYMVGMQADFALYVIGIKGEDGQVDAIELYVVHITELDVDLEELFAKVRAIESAVERAEMPKCEKTLYPCPYFFLHDEEDEKITVELVSPELDDLFDLYRTTCNDIKALEVQKKELMAEVFKAFDDRDARGQKIKTSAYEVVDVVRLGAKKLDMKKVEEAGIDLSSCYSVGKESRWPKIKELSATNQAKR